MTGKVEMLETGGDSASGVGVTSDNGVSSQPGVGIGCAGSGSWASTSSVVPGAKTLRFVRCAGSMLVLV